MPVHIWDPKCAQAYVELIQNGMTSFKLYKQLV